MKFKTLKMALVGAIALASSSAFAQTQPQINAAIAANSAAVAGCFGGAGVTSCLQAVLGPAFPGIAVNWSAVYDVVYTQAASGALPGVTATQLVAYASELDTIDGGTRTAAITGGTTTTPTAPETPNNTGDGGGAALPDPSASSN